MALETLFNDIAAAIHEKDGKTDGIAAKDFPARIRAIPTDLGGVRLESIEITAPPTETLYPVGAAFNPEGMVVYAHFSNGQSMPVDLSNLTFDPAGPLEDGTASVTVNFQWGLKLVSAAQPIEVSDFVWWSPHMTSDTAPAPYQCAASSNQVSFGSSGIFAAFDGNDSTFWHSNSSRGQWISFDFGAPTHVRGVRFMPRDGYPNQLCSTGTIQGSDDNESWTDILSFSGLPTPPNLVYREHMFDATEGHRYYRIANMSSNYPDGMSYVTIADIEFYVEE